MFYWWVFLDGWSGVVICVIGWLVFWGWMVLLCSCWCLRLDWWFGLLWNCVWWGIVWVCRCWIFGFVVGFLICLYWEVWCWGLVYWGWFCWIWLWFFVCCGWFWYFSFCSVVLFWLDWLVLVCYWLIIFGLVIYLCDEFVVVVLGWFVVDVDCVCILILLLCFCIFLSFV